MNTYLSMALAADRQRELLAAADRYRLAAAVASPATLRRKAGLRLVSIGSRLAGQPNLVSAHRIATQRGGGSWKPF